MRDSSEAELSSAAYASDDPREKLKQLRRVKAAYNRLKSAVPYLPPKGSVIPALLVARSSQDVINGTKDAINSTREQTAKTKSVLQLEEANLQDAKSNFLGNADSGIVGTLYIGLPCEMLLVKFRCKK